MCTDKVVSIPVRFNARTPNPNLELGPVLKLALLTAGITDDTKLMEAAKKHAVFLNPGADDILHEMASKNFFNEMKKPEITWRVLTAALDMLGVTTITLSFKIPEGGDMPAETPIEQKDDPVIAIQVVPFIDAGEDKEVFIQPEGPTEETSGWGVYYRHKSGRVVWAADSDDEDSAMIVGRELAQQEGVEIEPQAWN